MKKTFKQFREDWNNIDKIKIFEIPVIGKRTNERSYVIFDISIKGRSFIAQHESLNSKQEKSKKIAFNRVQIDTDYSIDWHLKNLYEECTSAIEFSEFFELSE